MPSARPRKSDMEKLIREGFGRNPQPEQKNICPEKKNKPTTLTSTLQPFTVKESSTPQAPSRLGCSTFQRCRSNRSVPERRRRSFRGLRCQLMISSGIASPLNSCSRATASLRRSPRQLAASTLSSRPGPAGKHPVRSLSRTFLGLCGCHRNCFCCFSVREQRCQRCVNQLRVTSEDYAPVSPLGIVPVEGGRSAKGSSVDSHPCSCSS